MSGLGSGGRGGLPEIDYPPEEANPANAAPMAKSTMIAANIANDPRDWTACGVFLM
jgi:hypothetical protein